MVGDDDDVVVVIDAFDFAFRFRKAEEIVEVLEVLLVVHPSVAMVRLVTGSSTQNFRKNVVGLPRQIPISGMRLR